MGLFGKKKTYVSSVVYNLAGDEAKRPQFLKSLVIGEKLIPSDHDSLGEAVVDGLLNGPGIRLRNYYNWTQHGYSTAMGLTTGGFGGSLNLDPAVVASQIPRPGGTTVFVQTAQISPADFEFWAEQWICDHEPATLGTAWTADYSDTTGQITIHRADLSTVSFTPDNFGKTGLYVLAGYNLATNGAVSALVTGSTSSGPAFPSTTGWSVYSSSTLHHTDLGGWDETHVVYTKTQYMGDDGTGRLYSRTSYMHQDQLAHDNGAGAPAYDRSWRTDTQDTTITTWSTLKVFIYRIGWGNVALDAMVGPTTADNSFFPPIPVRINNQFLSETYLSTEYGWAKKAYRKMVNSQFDALVDTLTDNPNLGDIDYVYAMPGVSLNVRENSCRQYIYNFLHRCMTSTAISEADYDAWQVHQADADAAAATWQAWFAAQSTPGSPLFGAPEPPHYAFTERPKNMVRIATDASPTLGFDMRIYWQLINESTGSGLAKPGAKKGEVWWVKGDVASYSSTVWGGSVMGSFAAPDDEVETTTLFWQVDATSWKKLTIKGLIHYNFIYKGKFEAITAHEALDDADESGFIFPIHHGVWREMSLVTNTQMATASVFLVMNCYKIVKQKWYQTGIFKIIVFVALVVFTVINPPAGSMLDIMMSGAAGATGILIGISIAVATVLGEMILMQMVMKMLVAVFGAQMANIIMTVLAVVFITNGASLDFSNISAKMGQLMRAEKILKLTMAAGNGYAGYLGIEAQQTYGKIADLQENYATESKRVADLYADNIGYDTALLDPFALLEASTPQFVMESHEAFLTRTLMTGSEVAQMSFDLLYNFAELTLNTELPV